MREKNEQDDELIERGNLWSAFVGTEYFRDLKGFFDEQESLGKQAVLSMVALGQFQEASAAANKLNGILAVREYILDSVKAMNDLMAEEQEEKRYRKSIPNHV